MRYKIKHQSCYRYSRPVFLEPQIIRLQPRCDVNQRPDDFYIRITPQPAGLCQHLDAEGNQATSVWFNGLTENLQIETSFTVETRLANPFDYLITEPNCENLPASYAHELDPALACHLTPIGDATVSAFAAALAWECNHESPAFLTRLCAKLYEFNIIIRPEGDPLPPQETLQTKCGSCRDLALLFMAVCRCQGLAARFVSGYQEGDPDQNARELHAWAEVYLPGGGWRGYDPTHGLVVSDRHIVVAASFAPAGAAPLSGNFRGTGATAELSFNISLTRERPNAQSQQ
ncbi:MAG: transglutaminase family protein [Deltaproteobacteria bacterium]|nr:transglutaminase family protein [Deltaproteobacteria bacterium]